MMRSHNLTNTAIGEELVRKGETGSCLAESPSCMIYVTDTEGSSAEKPGKTVLKTCHQDHKMRCKQKRRSLIFLSEVTAGVNHSSGVV